MRASSPERGSLMIPIFDASNLRRMLTRVSGSLVCLLMASSVSAQQALPQPAQNISSGRTYYFEISLLFVLFGVALYAVCRGSHQHR